MNRFTKSYHAKQRKQKARAHRAQSLLFVVIVYDKNASDPALSMVEKKHFSSYEAATEYAKIYENSATLGAYVQ